MIGHREGQACHVKPLRLGTASARRFFSFERSGIHVRDTNDRHVPPLAGAARREQRTRGDHSALQPHDDQERARRRRLAA